MAIQLDGTTGISTTGNIISNGTITATNIALNNILTPGNISAAGNITAGGSLTVGSFAASALSASGNVTGGNLITGGLISATGNITGNYILGNGALLTGVITSVANINNGTSNVTVVSSGGNVTVGIGGTGNVAVFASTGEYVTGVVSASGNITGGNLNAAGLSLSGNVVSPLAVTGNITGGNIISVAAMSAATLTTTSDVVVGGNLTVNGDTTYNNVTSFNVEDPIISLGRGANNAPLVSDDGKDRGEQLWYYSGSEKSAFVGFNNTADKLFAAIDVSIANEIVTINSYGNFVVGNLEGATVSTTGNITGNYYIGNGSQLTSVVATGVGVLPSLSVTGNTITGNLNALEQVSAVGNITGGNIVAGSIISATGNILSGNNIIATANITGGNILAGSGVITTTGNITGANVISGTTFSASGNVTGGNINTAGLVSVTGNVTASGNVSGDYILGNGALLTGVITSVANINNGNSNITVVSSGGNITASVGGTSNVVVWATTGEYVNGIISATGNITGNYFIGNGSALTGIIAGATTTFSSTAPGSPAIGDVWIQANTAIQYVYFNDDTSSQWAEMEAYQSFSTGTAGGGVAGSNTQIQFNDAGSAGASANLTFDNSSNTLSTTTITATGNITGGNVISGGVRVYKWTTQANTAPLNSVPGDNWYDSYADKLYLYVNDGTGNQWVDQSPPTTFASLTVTGNTASGNLLTAGIVSATGNITGSYFIGNGSQLTGISGGGFAWAIANSNITLSANNGYFVDTTGGAKTMTLPASASIGDTIRINDLAGTFSSNNLTVARNGGNIQGVAQDLVVSVDQSSFGLVYSNGTYGWKLLEL